MALTQVKTSGIADDAVTLAKQAGGTDGNLITYNASGDPAVVTTGNSGQVLTSNGAGAAPTFQAASGGISDVVSDTSPQLGGDLDTNSFEIGLDDSHKVKFGDGNDLAVWHTGSHAFIQNDTGNLNLSPGGDAGIKVIPSGAVELYHNDAKKLETDSGGIQVFNNIDINSNGSSIAENNLRFQSAGTAYIDHASTGQDIQVRMSASGGSALDTTGPKFTHAGNLAFASGKGIDFSATSDASGKDNELFDDYEEGQWTPTINSSGGSTSKTYTSQKGWYIKVGRVVHMFYELEWNSGSGTAGNMYIGGFPFTTSNTTNFQAQYTGSCMMHNIDVDGNSKNIVLHSWNDADSGKFYSTLDNSGWSVTGWDTAGMIIGQISILATG